MQYATTITQKGQATIPIHIRRKLRVKAGEKVIFEEREDEVVVKAVPDFLSLMGTLKMNKKYDKQKVDTAVGRYISKQHSEKLLREKK